MKDLVKLSCDFETKVAVVVGGWGGGGGHISAVNGGG